jgi:hypothetical protein
VATVALRVRDADADEARGTDEDYDDAYDAWLDLPVGDELCDEYEVGKLTDELIEYVYPTAGPRRRGRGTPRSVLNDSLVRWSAPPQGGDRVRASDWHDRRKPGGIKKSEQHDCHHCSGCRRPCSGGPTIHRTDDAC